MPDGFTFLRFTLFIEDVPLFAVPSAAYPRPPRLAVLEHDMKVAPSTCRLVRGHVVRGVMITAVMADLDPVPASAGFWCSNACMSC